MKKVSTAKTCVNYTKIAMNEKRKLKERIVAIHRIESERTLYKLATRAKSCVIRLQALNGINKKRYLENIAKYDENATVRVNAVKKISDNALLYSIAIKDKSKTVASLAISKITSEYYLKKIIKRGSWYYEPKGIDPYLVKQAKKRLDELF